MTPDRSLYCWYLLGRSRISHEIFLVSTEVSIRVSFFTLLKDYQFAYPPQVNPIQIIMVNSSFDSSNPECFKNQSIRDQFYFLFSASYMCQPRRQTTPKYLSEISSHMHDDDNDLKSRGWMFRHSIHLCKKHYAHRFLMHCYFPICDPQLTWSRIIFILLCSLHDISMLKLPRRFRLNSIHTTSWIKSECEGFPIQRLAF